MQAEEEIKITLSNGDSIDFHKSYISRSTFLEDYIEEFNTSNISIIPPKNKSFQLRALQTVKRYLEIYPKDWPKLPKKPFLSTTNWEDYLEKNPDVKEIFDKFDDFYEIVELFNCANYLKVNDLLELIGAKIAYHIMFNRQSAEDHLREFSLVTKYKTFFTADEEAAFRDQEFANPTDFEDVIDYYEELEALP